MGGPPKTSTKKDMRLKANNPNAGRPKPKPAGYSGQVKTSSKKGATKP